MEHARKPPIAHSPNCEAAPDTAKPVHEIVEAKHSRWSPDKMIAFLHALASSHNVSKAAEQVGMNRSSAYRLRAKFKGEPFDLAWEAAMSCQIDAVADAAIERALNGVEVPHFYKGELIHTSRKFDERLTLALLSLREKRRPTYIPQSHPAAAYQADGTGSEFVRLIERVKRGPQTWDEGGY